MEGKYVGENLFFGSLVKLFVRGVLVKFDFKEINFIFFVFINIKINLLFFFYLGVVGEDIYVKVLDKFVEFGYFYILFIFKLLEFKVFIDI